MDIGPWTCTVPLIYMWQLLKTLLSLSHLFSPHHCSVGPFILLFYPPALLFSASTLHLLSCFPSMTHIVNWKWLTWMMFEAITFRDLVPIKNGRPSLAWWCMLLIQVLERPRWLDSYELEASLVDKNFSPGEVIYLYVFKKIKDKKIGMLSSIMVQWAFITCRSTCTVVANNKNQVLFAFVLSTFWALYLKPCSHSGHDTLVSDKYC